MITQERLKEILDYNYDFGIFIWRINRNHQAKIGKITGCKSSNGILIRIAKKNYLAHRLAWLYVKGEWPSECLDHINGNPHDNRFLNLRLANHAQNMQNSKRHKNNRLGVKGVTYNPRYIKKYIANIMVNRKEINIGRYDTLEEAKYAYEQASLKYHGEYGRAA